MTQARTLSVQLTAPAPGMTLQNVHVQRGPAGVVICVTWRNAPPAFDVAAALEDAGTSPQLPANGWLQQKFKEWKNAS